MKKQNLIFLILTMIGHLHAMPWGKDAELAYPCCPKPPQCEEGSPMQQIGEVLIDFHQTVISPADGPRSHYIPSSSQYTLESIRKHGFIKGWILGCDRLMRENEEPWIYTTVPSPEGGHLKWNPSP